MTSRIELFISENEISVTISMAPLLETAFASHPLTINNYLINFGTSNDSVEMFNCFLFFFFFELIVSLEGSTINAQ